MMGMTECAVEFTPENRVEFEKILGRYPQKRAALLPTLYLMQKQEGFISMEAIRYLAGLLEMEPVEIYGVITFYTMLHLEPVGRFHLQVCNNVSCQLMGSEKLLAHIKQRLGIGVGEKTPDGLFSLSVVECLGSCGTAPVIQVNLEPYWENLDLEKLDRLLDELKSSIDQAGES